MNLSELQADQLYTWSDHYAPHIAQTTLVRFAKTVRKNMFVPNTTAVLRMPND